MRFSKSALLFVAFGLLGLAMLFTRILARPGMSMGEVALPLLGGLAMLVALFWIVRGGHDKGAPPP
ncbi:MAG TPA: hypothetical protein VEB64_11535 [Azospirillaceae bacterium]|nr:hypothetical protein [Azospirillaceae bacterium]